MATSPVTDGPQAADDLVSPAVAQLIALFDQHPDLKFPGISAQSLGARAEEVERQLSEVERLELALGEAREKLFLDQQALLRLAKQAHAYATVYASDPATEDQSALAQQLGAIQLEGDARGARKRRPKPPAGNSAEPDGPSLRATSDSQPADLSGESASLDAGLDSAAADSADLEVSGRNANVRGRAKSRATRDAVAAAE